MTVIEIELDTQRVLAGLPSAPVEIPAHILDARHLNENDIIHCLAAHISATHKPNVEPPLNIHEEVARTQAVRSLARQTIELSGPWQS